MATCQEMKRNGRMCGATAKHQCYYCHRDLCGRHKNGFCVVARIGNMHRTDPLEPLNQNHILQVGPVNGGGYAVVDLSPVPVSSRGRMHGPFDSAEEAEQRARHLLDFYSAGGDVLVGETDANELLDAYMSGVERAKAEIQRLETARSMTWLNPSFKLKLNTGIPEGEYGRWSVINRWFCSCPDCPNPGGHWGEFQKFSEIDDAFAVLVTARRMDHNPLIQVHRDGE